MDHSIGVKLPAGCGGLVPLNTPSGRAWSSMAFHFVCPTRNPANRALRPDSCLVLSRERGPRASIPPGRGGFVGRSSSAVEHLSSRVRCGRGDVVGSRRGVTLRGFVRPSRPCARRREQPGDVGGYSLRSIARDTSAWPSGGDPFSGGTSTTYTRCSTKEVRGSCAARTLEAPFAGCAPPIATDTLLSPTRGYPRVLSWPPCPQRSVRPDGLQPTRGGLVVSSPSPDGPRLLLSVPLRPTGPRAFPGTSSLAESDRPDASSPIASRGSG